MAANADSTRSRGAEILKKVLQQLGLSTLIDSFFTERIDDETAVYYIWTSHILYPNYHTGKEFYIPLCRLCGKKLHLVVQLYCPLQHSDYHRTLYVFACSFSGCWNKSDSWTVYRCQSKLAETQTPTVQSAKTKDDWGGGCDDWGSDCEDWGDEDDDPGVDIVGEKVVTGNELNDEQELSAKSICDNTKSDNINEDECQLPLETMCIEDADNIEEEKELSHVISEDLPAVCSSLTTDLLSNKKSSIENHDNCSLEFESYYINVFEESDVIVDKDVHVSKLLREYEKREGHVQLDVSMDSSSASRQGEKYEKTSIRHGDFHFHRFMKQIALCPEQCIRYCWNSSPLYMATPTSTVSNICVQCKGELVFELQLMPALVNVLKFQKHTDASVEFGTVLIFTCKESCWEDVDCYRSECVYVQSDPDQDRFNSLTR